MDVHVHINQVGEQRRRLGPHPTKEDIRESVLDLKQDGYDRFGILKSFLITFIGGKNYGDREMDFLNEVLAEEFEPHVIDPTEEDVIEQIRRMHEAGMEDVEISRAMTMWLSVLVDDETLVDFADERLDPSDSGSSGIND